MLRVYYNTACMYSIYNITTFSRKHPKHPCTATLSGLAVPIGKRVVESNLWFVQSDHHVLGESSHNFTREQEQLKVDAPETRQHRCLYQGV